MYGMYVVISVPVMESQVKTKINSLDESVQRKLQCLLKWSAGMVLKKVKL